MLSRAIPLLCLALLSACQTTPVLVPPVTPPGAEAPLPGQWRSLGMYELQVTEANSSTPKLSVRPAGGLQAQASEFEAVKFEVVGYGAFNHAATQKRYLQASFKVTNLSAGTAVPIPTFLPIVTTGGWSTTGDTPFRNVKFFDGSDASALASSIALAPMKQINAQTGNVEVQPSATPYRTGMNTGNISVNLPAGTQLGRILPDGWVGGHLAPGAQQVVNFGLELPLRSDPKLNPYSFSLLVIVADQPASTGSALNCDSTPLETLAQTSPSWNWGTYDHLFNADSLWNSRPVNPVLGTYQLPPSVYNWPPQIGDMKYSTGIFRAQASDPPVEVRGALDANGNEVLRDPDVGGNRVSVTIPHFPAGVVPAVGTDGSADIVDTVNGRIYSFWQLKQDAGGQWRATQFAWSPLDGRGWADPAHYYQGARATGVATSGGVIRKSEFQSQDCLYRHALVASLPFEALAKTYVYPATANDFNSDQATGAIPEGTRLMLPPDFDVNVLPAGEFRRVARTLMVYGVYAADRNVGTPYSIYAEIDPADPTYYSLGVPDWNTRVAALDIIRKALRPVESQAGFINGHNQNRVEDQRQLNLFSMRGDWKKTDYVTKVPGIFDTFQQAAVLPDPNTTLTRGGDLQQFIPTWAKIQQGEALRLTVHTSNGGSMLFRISCNVNGTYSDAVNTGFLSDGQSVTFNWPANSGCYPETRIKSAASGSVISAELRRL